MFSRSYISVISLLSLLLLAGCTFDPINRPGIPTSIQTVATNTLLPPPSTTIKFTATPVPTNTLVFTATPAPTSLPVTEAIAPTPQPTPTAAQMGSCNFAAQNQACNLRAGPGTQFVVLAGLRSGTRVIVLGANSTKDWFLVRLEDGSREGWLAESVITVPNREQVVVVDQSMQATMTQAAGSTSTPGGSSVSSQGTRRPGEKRLSDVLAYCDSKTNGEPRKTLTSGTQVFVYWSWFARQPEQLADHISYAEYEVQVDGQPLANWRNFKSDVSLNSKDNNYYVYWYVPIGAPPAGEHKIDFKLTWKQQITDGYKKFGPGPGSDEVSNLGSCVFTVKEK